MEHGATYEPDTGFNAAGATGILGGLATIAEVFSAIPMFGSGGYPGAGLFMAGEAGPEMLGTIGGRTAVAGGSEITGISSAVYAVGEAVIATLKSQNLDISLDGRRLAEGLYPYNKAVSTRHGTGLISG